MKNLIQRGDVIDVVVAADVLSGDAALVGDMVGFWVKSGASGETVGLAVQGVFGCDKAAAEAWEVGDVIAFDDAAGAFTTTTTGNTICGHAAEDAESAATEGKIRLGILAMSGGA